MKNEAIKKIENQIATIKAMHPNNITEIDRNENISYWNNVIKILKKNF